MTNPQVVLSLNTFAMFIHKHHLLQIHSGTDTIQLNEYQLIELFKFAKSMGFELDQ